MKQRLFFLLVITLAFTILTPALLAQESKSDTRKQEKAEKKRLKEEAWLADWNNSKKMADEKRFVFKANQLFTRDGTISLDPKINFLYVVDDYSILQFGFDGYFIGGNGVGGITTEGTVEKYKVIADDPKKPVQVELILKPKAGQGTGIGTIGVKFYGDGYGEVILSAGGYRYKGQFFKPEDANISVGNRL